VTVSVPITFHGGITQKLATFLQAADIHGNWTGMTQFGDWMYLEGGGRPGPSLIRGSASASQGTAFTYSLTATHTAGPTHLTMIHMLVSDHIVGSSACHVIYFPREARMNLVDDTGTGLISATGVPLGKNEVLANSRCAINVGLASRSNVGNNLTINVPFTFQSTRFAGSKNIYVNAFDSTGQLSHWSQTGTFSVR
jgi:hypothetical protein